MSIEITFPGGDRVDAMVRGHIVSTHQDDTAVSPFDLFLASIGTCAGIYVSRFCRQRGIDTRDLRIEQRMFDDPGSGMVKRIELEIRLPAGFPQRYREAVMRAAELCAVKKHLDRPPVIEVRTLVPTISTP
jgi:ribosomal protein S12 methylthiotransferase accessory factor